LAEVSTTTTTRVTGGQTPFFEDDIEKEIAIGVCSAISLVGLAIVAGICYYHRRKRRKKMRFLQIDDLGWYVLDSGRPVGPYDNVQMTLLFGNGTINKDSYVRLNWQSKYSPIGQIFAPGEEFLVTPNFSQDDADAPWHRHTVAGSMLSETWWYYMTPEGAIYGPFEAGKMRQWYLYKFFDDTVLVREGDQDGEFQSIAELFPKLDYAFMQNVVYKEEAPLPRPRASRGEYLFHRLNESVHSSNGSASNGDAEAQVIGKANAKAGGDLQSLQDDSAVKIQKMYRGNAARKQLRAAKVEADGTAQKAPEKATNRSSKTVPEKPAPKPSTGKPKTASAPVKSTTKSKVLAPPGMVKQVRSVSDTDALAPSSLGKQKSPKSSPKAKAKKKASSEANASNSSGNTIKSAPAV